MQSLDLLFDEDSAAHFSVSGIDRTFMQVHCASALRRQAFVDFSGISVTQLSISWLDEPAMRSLNLQFRGKDSPTNVLSFESGLPVLDTDDTDAKGQVVSMLVLGDIILCPTVIQREAQQQGKPEQEHWAHMLVHGALHLCGYDHEDAEQAVVMESLEAAILSGAGIPDPYQVLSS